MSYVKIIYDIHAFWEKDYIRELFTNLNCDIIYVYPEKLIDKLDNEDNIINNNILVFSSNIYSYEKILNIVIRIKPLIIVHLSDEFGTRPQYTHLALYTKLLLHQYHFSHYPYDNYNNIFQIPLGYMINMFNGNNAFNYEVKPILERKYKWSFVGNMKHDRQELINKFSQKFSQKIVENNISSSKMFDIYNDSIFIPNGRGNVVLDCFRIYEAIFSGGIPIIVCNKKEFVDTFYYNNDILPFIYEETWDDAVNKCEYLLNNTNELYDIFNKNYNWLQQKIKSIQKIIYLIINS